MGGGEGFSSHTGKLGNSGLADKTAWDFSEAVLSAYYWKPGVRWISGRINWYFSMLFFFLCLDIDFTCGYTKDTWLYKIQYVKL